MSCFLARLRHEIEMMVRMFNPKTLQDAYSLAKLQEAVRVGPAMQGFNGVKGVYSKNVGNLDPTAVAKTNFPGHDSGRKEVSKVQNSTGVARKALNLTPKQIEEKRAKNQCFWCVSGVMNGLPLGIDVKIDKLT